MTLKITNEQLLQCLKYWYSPDIVESVSIEDNTVEISFSESEKVAEKFRILNEINNRLISMEKNGIKVL